MKPLVLVSGGAGFIGSHTCDLLLKKGYKVRILDNLSSKTHDGGWPRYLDKKIEKVKGDVRNKKDWKKALKGVNYVIHLAAWMDLLPEFSKFFDINVVGTANLYEVIVEDRLPVKKIIVASSQFVYGEGKWKCKKDGIVFPNSRSDNYLQKRIWDPLCPKCHGKITPLTNTEDYQNPSNQYAISKYAEEMMSLKLGELYGIPTVALRYSIVHGARQSTKNIYSGALRTFVLQILRGDGPLIFEDGEQFRDYVSAEDVAVANIVALENKKSDFRVFNVGGGKGYTVNQLAKMVAHALRKQVAVQPSGLYRVGDVRHAVSNTRAFQALGWRPKHKEEESIEEFIKHLSLDDVGIRLLMKKTFKNMERLGVLKKSRGSND